MSEAVDGERWARLRELFDELVELPVERRAARLLEIGDEEPARRTALERLLAEVGEAGPLDVPAAEAFPDLLQGLDRREPDEAVGRRIGPYRLVEELGRGGMGVVYLAERADGQFEQRVALKLVKRGLDTDEVLARFRRERQILARLDHRSIARLYDGGAAEDGRPYFAMEYVVGQPITDYCDDRRLSIEERLRLFRRVCEAVEHAHRHHVVHRDLKPSNILVTAEGDLKLLDFGVAKVLGSGEEGRETPTLTRIGLRAMTPEYAAPEQILGRAVSPATDVYALGVVLYELLTGRRPYRLARQSGPEIERTIIDIEPPRLSAIVEEALEGEGSVEGLARARGLTPAALRRRLAGDLDAIALTTLRKEPERRYVSTQALGEDIERHLTHRAVKAHPESPVYRVGKLLRRHGTAVASVGLMTFAGAAILYMARRAPTASDTPSRPKMSLSSIRRLTSLPGLEYEPTWSPDGQYIAFSSDVSGNWDIWIVPASGGSPRQLTLDLAEDGEPSWSPDGATILFRSRRQGGGLFTMPALGGEATRLLDFGYRPRWSADGRRILFQLRPKERRPNEVRVLDHPGGAPLKLLAWEPGKDPHGEADWSPDGRFVVSDAGGWESARGIFVQPVSPSAPGFFLEWGGRRLAGYNPVWPGQGGGIIFAQRSEAYPLDQINLIFAPLDATAHVAGPTERLTTGACDYPAVSRDGRRLAYTSDTGVRSDIWKVALSLTTGLPIAEPMRVTHGTASESAPAVLPDNRHLLFLSDRDSGSFLYVSDLEGRAIELVDRSHNWHYLDAISPDGRWLVLRGAELGGSPGQSYLLPFDPEQLEATGPARLLGVSVNRASSFSPDGRYLLQSSYHPGTAVLAWENPASPDRQEVRWPLSADFLEKYPVQILPRFSPDGSWVVFGSYGEVHKPAIFLLRRGSDTPRLVWEGSRFAAWNNDPHRIYIFSERDDETGEKLGFLPFDPATGATGSFQPIELRPVRGESSALQHWLTPDRRWLFFAWFEPEGDIFVADLVRG